MVIVNSQEKWVKLQKVMKTTLRISTNIIGCTKTSQKRIMCLVFIS